MCVCSVCLSDRTDNHARASNYPTTYVYDCTFANSMCLLSSDFVRIYETTPLFSVLYELGVAVTVSLHANEFTCLTDSSVATG